MSNLLKDLYSPAFYEHFTTIFKKVVPKLNKKKFIQLIFDKEWEERELKSRMRHTAETLHHFMPTDFTKACDLLLRLVETLKANGTKEVSVEYMFLPDYVALYGLEDCEKSIEVMEWLTPFTSCEFAIRPFFIKYPKRLVKQCKLWSKHENFHVRRLASEGCRPRLPWALALPALKKDPTPILPILEQLKNDPTEYVRKSVANNLNDISKDHPELVLQIGKKWKGKNKNINWIVKHSCRTLLKQGNKTAMELFDYSPTNQLQVNSFVLETPVVKIGDHLAFSFQLKNKNQNAALVRIEYGIHYLKANGEHSQKVFKITERRLDGKASVTIERKQSFRVITTKKFYPGTHRVALILNGDQFGLLDFELIGN